jgi:hypothetical protein
MRSRHGGKIFLLRRVVSALRHIDVIPNVTLAILVLLRSSH